MEKDSLRLHRNHSQTFSYSFQLFLFSLPHHCPGLFVRKVFISYVENPHALHNDHPDEYKKLHKAWLEMGREEVCALSTSKWDDPTPVPILETPFIDFL